MLGKTHRVGGISAAIITSTALYASGATLFRNNPEVIPAIIAGGWLGGLMPDIDHPNSTISNTRILGIPIFKPIGWIITTLFGHRGATHTLWALFLTWLPFLMAPLFIPDNLYVLEVILLLFGLGYAVGYFSHIFLDSLTPMGTPMLWPLPDVHLGKLTTGKYDGAVRVVMITGTFLISWGLMHFAVL